jgi:hypothetical protein
MGLMARIILVVLLLLAPRARAVQLHFEAWPTLSSETCPAPCYQMRMFLQVDPWDMQQSIQAIQMDIRVGDGAVPAELPIHPARNDNAGPGNVHARSDGTRNVGVPWDLVSVVAQSPTEGFDALMVHAASDSFTVEALTDSLNNPDTTCADTDGCGFVEEALALNRVYLGFMNITRSAELPSGQGPGHGHTGPIFGYENWPQPGVPFFIVQVGNIYGIGDAPELLAQYGGDTGFVLFLPEPTTASVVAFALAMLVAMRIPH